MSHVELFSEENNARQGREDGFHAHQDAESLRGKLLEGDDFQPIGQRRGKDAKQQSQREYGHGEHGRPRRGYAEGQDGAGPDDHAERDGCAASGVPCPLAEKDVHGPAESGSERKGHAHGIEIAGKFVNGQQQEQAADSQRNPQEVDEAARTEHGYRQRPGELQRHAHAQRDAADGLMIRDGEDVQLDNIARSVIANNAADCHIALHWDSTTSNKGAFYMSVPDVASYKNMEPVKSHWQQHNALGASLVEGLKSAGVKIFSGGSMAMDLTQTSYSTVPSVDIELGDKASDHSQSTLNQLGDGLVAGVKAYFGQ